MLRDRKLTRLSNYNYSQVGFYFITICTKAEIDYFGKIENCKMILNEYGEIVKEHWNNIPRYYENVEIDQFIIMPNHIHGIIVITDHVEHVGTERVGTEQCSVPTTNTNCFVQSTNKKNNKTNGKNYGLLSKVVKSFKNVVTKKIRMIQNNEPFQWQRSFYDHIISNEKELEQIRAYIQNNPLKWDIDKNNRINLDI